MAEPTNTAPEADSFFEQVSGKPEGHVVQQDLQVDGDAFAGASDEVVAAVAVDEAAAAKEADDAATAAAVKEANESGQKSDPPPDTKEGQEKVPEKSPADTKKDEKPEGSETDDSTVNKGEEKPLPFDQDPKWQAARAAEKVLNDILERNNLADADELNSMLDSGIALKDIIGENDAKLLVEKAQKMDRTEQFWTEQEALQRETDETPEQTRDRLKVENKNLKTERTQREAQRTEVASNQKAVRDFESTVDKAVDATNMSAPEKAMARSLLGVDNPIDAVDIDNSGQVNKSVGQGIENFETFLETVKQTAVDQYAAGESKRTPIPNVETPPGSEHVTKKVTNPKASVQETFDAGKAELTEVLTKIATEGE